jgi:hypothetical protein|tara:strand:- start:108 stop:311 length:204 start_codon:yes stop_codon:yes gene_type:complete
LEFDERVLRIGDDAAVRVAATVDFPREFPVTDESPLRLSVRKLGAKKVFRWYGGGGGAEDEKREASA